MLKRMLPSIVASGMLWVLFAAAAAAQSPNPYAGGMYARPAVSPYLNLAVTRDGMSNYPTLVRPLIEDQNAIMHQAAHIQRLEQQLRLAQGGAGSGAGGNPRSSVPAGDRFLNLSHYYRPAPNHDRANAARR